MAKKEKSASLRILKYFKYAKGSIVIFTILMIVSSIIDVFNPIVEANLITSLTGFNVNTALFLAIALIVIIAVKSLVSHMIIKTYNNKIRKSIILGIQKDIYNSIFSMKTINYDKHTSGEFIERINDPERISNILTIVQYSLVSIIGDIIVLGYVFYLNYIIGLIYLFGLLFIGIYQKMSYDSVESLTEEQKYLMEKNTTLINEMTRGIRDVKVLNIMAPVYNLLVKSADATLNKANEKTNTYDRIYSIATILRAIVAFLVLLVGIILVQNKMLTVTGLLVIYMYRNQVFDIILCYKSIKEYFIDYKLAAKRIFEVIDGKEYPKEHFGEKKIKTIKGKITINNLSFAYNKKKVLDNITLIMEPNDTVAIVGSSGSGKTTLLSLLSKSYDVPNNKILIDDIDINDLTKDSIRENISVISQTPYIFNLTIKENLEMMGEKVTFSEIKEVCKVAQIHDFIMTLPNKYDTVIGENGTLLSGGQKQRLAIARALIKKSKIILFDEATSALDNVTQNELQKAIDNISKDYTMVVVAHRLSTIMNCDKIVVLEKGKIVDIGTHSQLLKRCKEYKKLYKEESKKSE